MQKNTFCKKIDIREIYAIIYPKKKGNICNNQKLKGTSEKSFKPAMVLEYMAILATLRPKPRHNQSGPKMCNLGLYMLFLILLVLV